MSIKIGTGFIAIDKVWPEFKAICEARKLKMEWDLTYVQNYAIWHLVAVDKYVAFTTHFFNGDIPESSDFSAQSINDNYKNDFLTNYYTTEETSQEKKSSKGVVGSAAAKGLGDFSPSPTANPEEPAPDEVVSLYVDAEGSLVTRGYTFTDEGSFREDFGGTFLSSSLAGESFYISGSGEISGSGTSYMDEVSRDYYVRLSGTTEWFRVIRVPENGDLLVDGTLPDLSGTLEKARWIYNSINPEDGIISVDASYVILSSSAHTGSHVSIERFGDYGPMYGVFRSSLTQRLEGQETYFGFADDKENINAQTLVKLDGTDNKKIKFLTSTVSSSSDENTEISEVYLPGSLTTENDITYKINVSPDYCSLTVNDVLLAEHDVHIPGPYSEMGLFATIKNITTASLDTLMKIDSIFFSNQNQLQVANSFTKPIPVVSQDNQHSIFGSLITNSTSTDQTVISYTVPSGSILYLVGYCVSVDGGASAQPMKIGRNDVSSENYPSGSTDSNIFRSFNIPWDMATPLEVNFGGNPRKLASEGEEVKVTVSPSSTGLTTWRVTLDYVLR